MENFIGQKKIVESIQILFDASVKLKKPFPHTLLQGPSGLGKTTLAKLIAEQAGAPLVEINAAGLKSKIDVVMQLTKIEPYTFVFLDEIHAAKQDALENLYTAMENSYVTIVVAGGEPVKQELPPFTLLAATTERIAKPITDRFGNVFQLEDYTRDELIQIIERYCDEVPGEALVDYCRDNPRIAKKRVDWVQNFCVSKDLSINSKSIREAMIQINVFPGGLTYDDINYLKKLSTFNKPVGLKNLTAHTGFSESKIIDIENYLLKNGYIFRTPQGRIINHSKTSWKSFSH